MCVCVCENHFIPYLAMRHRICTKVTKLLWLTMYSIIVGGIAPDVGCCYDKSLASTADQPLDSASCNYHKQSFMGRSMVMNMLYL